MEVSSERREAELAEAYNKANLTFGAFMAQFNEVCAALAGDMTIVNLEATNTTTASGPDEDKKVINLTKKGEDGVSGVDYLVVSKYTTAVDNTATRVLDPNAPKQVILDHKDTIRKHKEKIENDDNRFGFLNRLSREEDIKRLEGIIIELGGTPDE